MALLPANPGQALWVGSAGGKNHYNIGIGGPGGTLDHTDYSQSSIEDGSSPPIDATYFHLDSNGDVVFKQLVENGHTSANTKYSRTELRELQPNGTSNAAWDGASGDHYMKGRTKIDHVPSAKPWVCFFQVHDSSSDLARVQTEDGAIVCRRTPPGGSEIRTVIKTSYAIGAWIDWEMRITSGTLTVKLDGVTVLTASGMGESGCYFKMGNYNQVSDAAAGGGASPGEYCQITVQRGSFQTWHTGYATPTTPVFTGGADPGGGPGGGDGTPDTQAPSEPTGLTVTAEGAGLRLRWGAATDNVGVTGYRIYRALGTVSTPSGPPLSTAAGRFGWGTPLSSSDEFDYTGVPDPAKWNAYSGTGHGGNGVRSTGRVTVAGGKMILTGLAGSANTAGLEHVLDRQYGRWEVRCRSFYTDDPTNPGTGTGGYHPVLIIWTDAVTWPTGGEYDFLENGEPGEQSAGAFMHYPSTNSADQIAVPGYAVDLREFHNFGFEWTSAAVSGWIDGQEWFTYSGKTAGSPSGSASNIQTMPTGHLTVQLDAFQPSSLLASTMEIEWVRAYA